MRTVKAEDTFADVEHQIKTGIKNHYADIFSRALETRGDNDIPIVATGHLFLEAGTTRADEGEHSLYVGTAIKVGTDIFPEDIAYVALGHLHSPQRVGRPNIRYSGSPVYMSFGELGVTKTVSVVDFDGKNFAGVREIDIPVFQEMARISGDMAGIESGIRELASKNESVWLEVVYTGNTRPADIQKELSDLVKDSSVEILSIIDKMNYYKTPGDGANDFDGKILSDIEPLRMFERLMKSINVPEEKQDRMKELYGEILQEAKAEAE